MSSEEETTGAHNAVTTRFATMPQSARQATQELQLLQALERAEAGQPLTPEPADSDAEEHLLFWVGEAPYLVRLADLREVLPHVPARVALPFSPQWLWGIFPLRTELVALVDPAPMLLHGPEAARHATGDHAPRRAALNTIGQIEAPRALVIGEGDHRLALVADRVGDILLLGPDDQEDNQQQDGRLAPAQTQPQYVAGVYTIAGLERPALALQLAQFCEDIFATLEERPAHE